MVMISIKQQERLVSGEVAGIGTVTFKCRWWSKDVEVEMVAPYSGVKDGTHMLLAVPTHYGEAADCIYWQDVAWRLVRGIIAREEWKSHHRGAYEERLKRNLRMREEILGEIEKLKDGLAEARRTRVGGWCGAVLYGSKVKRLKTEMREWEQLAMEEEECRWLPTLMETSVFARDASRLPTVQMCGRGLRIAPDKDACNIVQSVNAKYLFERVAPAKNMFRYQQGHRLALKENAPKKDAPAAFAG